MTTNPWQSRFEPLDSAEVRKRFEFIPKTINCNQSSSPHDLLSRIKLALTSIAVPTTQSQRICELIVARAKSHSASAYPDAREFLYQSYRKDGPELPTENFPICMTGPSGIGKSTLIRRMHSILPPSEAIAIDMGHRQFPVVSAWYLSAKEFRTISEMLRRLIDAAGSTPSGKSINALAKQCRRLAYQFGISMIFLDELQFLTKSQNATARIVDAIYELIGIGVPVTIVANYSLITSLKRRPQQDRQRILGNTQILYHEPATSQDWKNLVSGMVRICPAAIRLDPDTHAASLHNLSAGTPRLLSLLISTALESCRGNDLRIGIDDLRSAYESPEFSICRNDIENINQQLATGERVRDDIWPPIRVPPEPQAALQQAAQEQALSETAKKLVEDSLTPSQLALLNQLKKSHAGTDFGGTVVPIGEGAKPKTADFSVGESILKKLRDRK